MSKIGTRLRRINQKLNDLGNYHVGIPLDRIDSILQQHGFMLIQEDGTPWSGLLCGEEGQVIFDLADIGSGEFAGYYYLRDPETDEVIDAAIIPKNGRNFHCNKGMPMKWQLGKMKQEEISFDEYQTFHAMEMQVMPIYDRTTMSFFICKHALSLSWYKMPSGKYEIVSYIS